MTMYKSTDTVKSELQWLRLGYVLKENAKSIYGYQSGYKQDVCIRFDISDVVHDPDQAKEKLRPIRHQYYLQHKENEAIRARELKTLEEAEKRKNEYMETHFTAWQLLSKLHRIPCPGIRPAHHKYYDNKFFYYSLADTMPVNDETYETLKALYIDKFGGWETIPLETTAYNGSVWWTPEDI